MEPEEERWMLGCNRPWLMPWRCYAVCVFSHLNGWSLWQETLQNINFSKSREKKEEEEKNFRAESNFTLLKMGKVFHWRTLFYVKLLHCTPYRKHQRMTELFYMIINRKLSRCSFFLVVIKMSGDCERWTQDSLLHSKQKIYIKFKLFEEMLLKQIFTVNNACFFSYKITE